MVVDLSKIDLREKPLLLLKSMSGKTICPISSAMNISGEILYNEVSKLSFSVPRYHDGHETEHYDDIISFKLIDWHDVGRFIVVNPAITDSGIKEIKDVTAYSLEYEFTFKKITLEESTYNFWNPATPDSTILGIILSYMPSWKVGEVDSSLVGTYRTFDAQEENLYDFMKSTLQTTYSCIFEFDTYARKVNVRNAAKEANQKPIYFSTENLIKELHVEENSDDIVTVLDVSGAEGVDIRAVNPMGTNKIYNLDYYMNEINFSPEMIEKWNRWKQTFEENQEPYYNLVMQRNLKIAAYETELAALTDIKGEYSKYDNQRAVTIQAIAQRLQTQSELNAINSQLNATQSKINAQTSKVNSIKSSIDDLTRQLKEINNRCSFESFFTDEEYKELNKYFIEDSIQDSTFVASSVPSYTKKKTYTKIPTSEEIRISFTNSKVSQKTIDNNTILYNISGGDVVVNTLSNNVLSNVIQGELISGAVNEVNGDGTNTPHELTVSLYLANGVQNGISFKTSNFTYNGDAWIVTQESNIFFITLQSGGYTYTEDVTAFDKNTVEWDLYQYGKDILQTKSGTTYTFDLDLEDFLSLDDFTSFKNEIELGQKVYLKVTQGVIRPVVVGVELDYNTIETIRIQFGSSFDINNSTYDLIDLTREAVSMGKRVDFSKYSFNQFIDSGASTSVNEFMNSALDAAVNAIISSSGQAFSIDGTGIRLRRWDDEDAGTYDDEQIWGNNNSIMFTRDNWSTASIGIGKFVDDNLGELYGIVAPNIVGTLLAGQNLVIESQKKDGGIAVFKVDADGAVLHNSKFELVNANNYGHIVLDPDVGFGIGAYPVIKEADGVKQFDYDSANDSGNAKFWVDMDGNVHFRGTLEGANGKFSGELQAASGTFQGQMTAGSININDQFIVDRNGNVTANQGIFKGTLQGANYQTANGINMLNSDGQFKSDYLDLGNITLNGQTGDITLGGNIYISGNIQWGSSNSPVSVQYSANGVSGWHTTYSSTDYFARYSYDGGQTWTSAVKIQGTDGINGTNGSDANVNAQNVFNALTSDGTKFGCFSNNGNSLYINATYIQTGSLNADLITTGSLKSRDIYLYKVMNGASSSNSGGVIHFRDNASSAYDFGYFCYDNAGSGTASEATSRIILNSTGALKLYSSGSMAIQSAGALYLYGQNGGVQIQATSRFDITTGSDSYGATAYINNARIITVDNISQYSSGGTSTAVFG